MMFFDGNCSDGKNKKIDGYDNTARGFLLINDDLVQRILERLPASSFAYASCVSKSWNRICRLILFSRPKLASALSRNPCSHEALKEVVDKALSEPIRPDFALVHYVGTCHNMKSNFRFLVSRLGKKTPIIFNRVTGAMGRDTSTNEFIEVNEVDNDSELCEDDCLCVSVTIGFLPGLKISVVALPKKSSKAKIQQFVTNIKDFSASASGSKSPVIIFLYGNRTVDQRPIVQALDTSISKETIFIGAEKSEVTYRSGEELNHYFVHSMDSHDTVTLVIVRDLNKPKGFGEIHFHAQFSRGLSPIGPVFQAISVRSSACGELTFLTGKRDGHEEILNGRSIRSVIEDEFGEHLDYPLCYIGITRKGKRFTGLESSPLSFYAVEEDSDDYLSVCGDGIHTRDYFQFYQIDINLALTSCNEVSTNITNLNLKWEPQRNAMARCSRNEYIGGFVFACCSRGGNFFGRLGVNSFPLLNNFPEAPLTGVFLYGEVARGFPTGYPAHCCLHVYSSVYLVLSYTP